MTDSTQPGFSDYDTSAHDPAAAESEFDAIAVAAAPEEVEPAALLRGLALALLVIPLGTALWVAIWNAGFIASIVAFGISFAAVWLYRAGSRSRVTWPAVWALIAIIVVALVVAFLAGIYSDFLVASSLTFSEAFTSPEIWAAYWDNIFNNPPLWSSYTTEIVMTIAFGALGCFGTVRRLLAEARG
jgi:hypothetical protein